MIGIFLTVLVGLALVVGLVVLSICALEMESWWLGALALFGWALAISIVVWAVVRDNEACRDAGGVVVTDGYEYVWNGKVVQPIPQTRCVIP